LDAERKQTILSAWAANFGDAEGLLWSRAPGRVNLIGEHTDYNHGYVLPIAIDRDVVVAFRANGTKMMNVVAANFEDKASFSLVDPKADPEHPWMVYPLGMARLMAEQGVAVPGLDIVCHGTVPRGGGLSSSAALDVALALAYLRAAEAKLPTDEIARMCQQNEHRFCGVKCGIMDMFVSLNAERGKAVYLDCRDLHYQNLPCMFDGARFIVCDTRVRHELASSEYNKRRAQCEEAAHVLAEYLAGVTSLRDVTIDQFKEYQDRLPSPMRQRARHVITENHRVIAATQALRDSNPVEFGILMDVSHDSLDEDYEVTCPELNLLVALARDCKGVYGSRMTGGGFGGCTVTLIDASQIEAFCKTVSEGYTQQTGLDPYIYVVEPEQGAEVFVP
jgi:galactokinase